MKSDSDIRQDVEAELRRAPGVHEKDIAVKVTDGTVTLSGFVRDYHQRHLAEAAIKPVKGVTAVANDIEVRLRSSVPTDPEIARAAVAALKLELPVAWEQVKVTVKQGWVSLNGRVEWQHQSDAAERAMRRLQGVVNVKNSVKVRPSLAAENVKSRLDRV